jgi:hypothetical protein
LQNANAQADAFAQAAAQGSGNAQAVAQAFAEAFAKVCNVAMQPVFVAMKRHCSCGATMDVCTHTYQSMLSLC